MRSLIRRAVAGVACRPSSALGALAVILGVAVAASPAQAAAGGTGTSAAKFAVTSAPALSPGTSPAGALSGPHVFGWGFNVPGAVSSDGTHVWVASFSGDSVTELDAATGALVQVITGPAYKFSGPEAISSDGTHVWVVNGYGGTTHNGSVTELDAATGALVQVLTSSQ